MKKLDSVKKPRSLLNYLITGIIVFSVFVLLIVIALTIASFYINNKTDVTNDLVLPIIRSSIIVFPIDALLVYLLLSLLTIYRFAKNKKVAVRDPASLYELSRTNCLCVIGDEVFAGDSSAVIDVVPLGKENKNEIVDIAGSIASKVISKDPGIHALQQLSYIPLFPSEDVAINNGCYEVDFKDKKYILGKVGEFKYRADELVKKKIEPYLLKGQQIILVASYEKDKKEEKYAEFADVFGVIVLKNEVNKDFKTMVEHLQNNNIEVKYISSDNPYSASEQAKAVGIKNAEKYIVLKEDAEINKDLVKGYVVFANVNEEQKSKLISVLESIKTVSTFSNKEVSNSQCALTYGGCEADVVIASKKTNPIDVYEESIYFSNKLKKLFALALFKTLFVCAYMLVASILSVLKFEFDYRPIGLGTIFVVLMMVSLLFDEGKNEDNKFLYKLSVVLSLSLLIILVMFVLYALQYSGLVYTGVSDLNTCLSMCGVLFIIASLSLFLNLSLPINKRGLLVFSIPTGIALVTTGILWFLSVYLNRDMFGIYFNRFDGQDILTIVLALFMFISLYFVITYLIDKFNKGGEE